MEIIRDLLVFIGGPLLNTAGLKNGNLRPSYRSSREYATTATSRSISSRHSKLIWKTPRTIFLRFRGS